MVPDAGGNHRLLGWLFNLNYLPCSGAAAASGCGGGGGGLSGWCSTVNK